MVVGDRVQGSLSALWRDPAAQVTNYDGPEAKLLGVPGSWSYRIEMSANELKKYGSF